MSILEYVVPFILVLGAVIFVHEAGHYLVARLFGVKVEVFSIGFGPEVTGWNDRTGTRWKLSVVPLGGYVKMWGEAGEDEEPPAQVPEEGPYPFGSRSLVARAWIISAGPIANFVFAIVILFGLFASAGLPTPLAVVGAVEPKSAAAVAGFEVGDTVVAIDGQPVRWFDDVRMAVSGAPGRLMNFTVERGGVTIDLTAAPTPVMRSDGGDVAKRVGLLGLRPEASKFDYRPVGAATAAAATVDHAWGLATQILNVLHRLVTGAADGQELGGPLRIAHMSGEVAQEGLGAVILFVAALSINLGLINLLPIPVLDGGHLALYAIEATIGKPLDKRIVEYCFWAGLSIIVGLIVFSTWNDIVQLNIVNGIRSLVS